MSDRMSINDCQVRAEDEGYNTATFDLVGPGGRKPCKWLDAYFGLFIVDDAKGFTSAKDVRGMDLWCENFRANSTEEA